MSLSKNVYYKSDFAALIGDFDIAKYLVSYLKEIGAETCIVEEDYIDKDYLIDFQKFYSRSFEGYKRFTRRLHFFGHKISGKKLDELCEKGDTERLEELLKPYLGFVIIKPVKTPVGYPLIGRSLLHTYSETDNANKRCFVGAEFFPSLFGVELEIFSVPFQMQDQRVSACATISLWSALHLLSETFEIPRYSPAEITEIATSFPSRLRSFPQYRGLILEQMLNCIKSLNLDTETIRIKPENENIIPVAIRAYLEAEIPVIATLRLESNTVTDRHAVVITGYKMDKDKNVIELYVHDDGIGPYSRVKPDGNFRKWINEWGERGYQTFLEDLIIPVYPKIRTPFTRIYFDFAKHREEIENSEFKDDLKMDLFLTTVGRYKKFLLRQKIETKLEILEKSFPRFVWVERFCFKEKIYRDMVFDATAVYPRLICEIQYV